MSAQLPKPEMLSAFHHFAFGQQPTLFDQFKAGIAAAATFHRAFQQTVGLETHPLGSR
jgi:hypothetical protein